MQVNSERAKCSGKPLSPPVPAKQSLARGGLVIVAQHPSSSSFYSNRTTTSTTTNENSRRSTHRRVFSDTTTAGLTASLRRKFSSVKNSGLALRRSISSATKPSKSTRSKSESLGQGSKSGMRHLQGRAASSAVSLSPDICEGGPAGLCSTPSSHPRTENPFESDSESEREMDEEDDVKVPLLLQQGTPTIKVSAKKRKIVTFRIDADEGYILWESKKSGISELNYPLLLQHVLTAAQFQSRISRKFARVQMRDTIASSSSCPQSMRRAGLQLFTSLMDDTRHCTWSR